MLKKNERLSRARFAKKPFKRREFAYGSVSFSEGEPGAAVVVSKKTCPTAVGRNRLRRRVYSVLRPLIRSGKVKSALIVYPRRTALEAPFGSLQSALISALAL